MEHERRSGAWRSLLRRWMRDRRGAIAPLAAVVITAALIGTFGAIDIGRLVTARIQLQDAVDSANLALARMPATTTDAAMQAKAQAWITANVTDPNIQNLNVATPIRTIGQVQLNVTANIRTTTASLLGVTTLPLEGHSTVKYGTTHVELTLVLDNTGSMNDDNKLTSLKAAATTLVNTLSASAVASGDPNALKVGVVPFTMTVNIGSGYQGQSWLTGAMPAAYGTTGDVVDPVGHADRFQLFSKMGVPWKGCIESRPMPYDVQDTPPSVSNPATLFVPFFSPDTPDGGNYNLPGYGVLNIVGQYDGYHYWSSNNYLPDLVADNYTNGAGGNWLNHQQNVAKYKSPPQLGIEAYYNDPVGPNAACDVAPLQRMTTNTATVLAEIASMVAAGDTEIPVGLMWGWHVVSPNLPFADGTPYGTSGVIKVIVLVTDGANTYSSSYDGNQSIYTAQSFAAANRITSTGTAAGVQSALDSRLGTLCNNMKTKNADGTWKINIYTVPLEVTDAGIKSLLQGCVTDPSNYLDVASSDQLAGAFANIAGSISALRVSH